MTHAPTDVSQESTQEGRRKGSSFNDVRRVLATRLKGSAPVTSAVPLEVTSRRADDAPTLRDVEAIEPGPMRALAVAGDAAPRFAAFLDGAQWSLVLWADGVPVVHGTVAAVIRQRHERRMTTWRGPVLRRALYAPVALLRPDWRDAIRDLDLEVVDTLAQRTPDSGHPFALQEIAYQCVLSAREAVERELAEQWCKSTSLELFVDGALAGSKQMARSEQLVGVVKSHQRMYTASEHLATLLRLARGERSTVVRVADSRRSAVASWYLRLRDATGHDPFWGLVRVEVALPGKADDEGAIAKRADEVSRWILAEALPLAVPDARWDKMVYGIRDCEEYLRAIQ